MALRVTDIWRQSKGIGRLSYTFRMMAYINGILILLLSHRGNDVSLGLAEYFTIALMLIVPHLLLYQFVRSGRNTRVIVNALSIDFFLVGWSMGVIHFAIIPCIAFALGAITNQIAARGLKDFYKVLLIPVGCAVSILFNGTELHLESTELVKYLTIGYAVLHYIMNSYVLNVSINRVRNQNQEIKKQRVEIEEQSEELKVLNDSLLDMNANLEQKVAERTRELEIKNKKLQEYAFVNSHKLRGPVARILGLVNLLDYKNIYDSELIVTQLRVSATELDDLTRDIAAKLEAEPEDESMKTAVAKSEN
jgi:signal transduction histidine kinase